MLKRKASGHDVDVTASASSVFGGPGTTSLKRKRLFRPKNSGRDNHTDVIMATTSALLDFVLRQEAFQGPRLPSLYADFRQQLDLNPDGYHANIAAWTAALTAAARAGLIPSASHDLLNIHTADDLARALQHPQYGTPTCLPAVFHEAVQKREMLLLKEFLSSKTSVYTSTWLPSPWSALQWSLRTVGVLGPVAPPEKLAVRNYVVLKNVEAAGEKIVQQMADATSSADRVLTRPAFLSRFAHALNSTAPLTQNDMNILLVFLARDKAAISYDAQTIKFAPPHSTPQPITAEDTAIASLHATLVSTTAQLPLLQDKITLADAAAREAIALKQTTRAKSALRTKKLAEQVLAQRAGVVAQLEAVYTDLQSAADQVEIVAAMRAGADALKSLNEKVGGAEGVQGVVDVLNAEMATVDEISSIINETDNAVDEVDIEDEFEALEKAERQRREEKEAARAAERLAVLDSEQKTEKPGLENAERQGDVEKKVDQASQGIAKLSFQQATDEHIETEGGAEVDGHVEPQSKQDRVPAYA